MSGISILKKIFTYEGKGEIDSANRDVVTFSIEQLLKETGADENLLLKKNDFAFYGSGWQSWGFGGEIDPGKNQKKYFPVVPQWKNYFTIPGSKKKSKNILQGSFIIYLRWNIEPGKSLYLVLASTGNIKSEQGEVLPPVYFEIDRKKMQIKCKVCSVGKEWKNGETVAELSIFTAADFFELKEKTNKLFAENTKRFEEIKFLNSGNENKLMIGGWESWYNHYADINTNLIEEDLEYLDKTENLIKVHYLDEKKPCVFQVDDGWEIALGEWEANTERFPQGMKNLAKSISDKGYIPGLWVAPFIVDWRTDFAKEHRDWILKDKKNKPVQAGLNFLWGDAFGKEQPGLPYSYYCLDLSRNEVIEYLDSLMEKVINQWGFRYIKLDFLFAGMLYGNFANDGASYQWFDRAVKVLTKRRVNNEGKPVAYLGCGMPFETSFNCFPLSRIGPDTKEDWDVNYLRRANFPARTSAFANLQSTLGHAFWDQSVYINDPDVVFLRYNNIRLTDQEKILIALVNFLFASQIMHSDDPVNFDKNKEGDFTKNIKTLYHEFEKEEFGLVNRDSKSYFIFSKNGKYTGFINLSDKPVGVDRKELLQYMHIKPESAVKLYSVVEYSANEVNRYIFNPHSISIYKIEQE